MVVGYGPAAHRLVDRLGHHGPPRPATVLGAEREPACNRPLLTAVLDGSPPARALRLPEPPLGTVVRLGVRVVAVDRRRRLVHTDDGALRGADSPGPHGNAELRLTDRRDRTAREKATKDASS
ncbi:hypothetical protein [Streptomyces sp. G-G2]|uniref:hypothetical protein n=1 Tax=Streptomyces sp. G-G2 TaxID=3046201 RepID=UPI0024B9D1A9|nr:hypothetical protein [Streptomyces sp. G-G2]MDJ0385315.1 hypothetical protein [Streptomyces sp. G-G2]